MGAADVPLSRPALAGVSGEPTRLRAGKGDSRPGPLEPTRSSIRARDVRDQAGSRQHLVALRGARPSGARVPRCTWPGTNGKGSVTAMAHAALRAAGIRPAATPLRTWLIWPSDSSFTIARRDPAARVDCGRRLSCADRLRASGALTCIPRSSRPRQRRPSSISAVRASTWRSSKSDSAAASMPPT